MPCNNPRWIDEEDGSHILVEGDELLPIPRIILTCGNIEYEDQERIVEGLKLLAERSRKFGQPGEDC